MDLLYKIPRRLYNRYERMEDEAYRKMKDRLCDDLVKFYRAQHSTMQLSPLTEGENTPLLPLFLQPDMNLVVIHRAFGGGREERVPVTSLDKIFEMEEEYCNEIYVTGDAGYGKTVFSKKLALTWCQAKKPDKDEEWHFLQDEVDFLARFDLVFLLLLGDKSRYCDIDDLILSQIIPQLTHSSGIKLVDLENILAKNKCFVILDGLDEWTHPPEACRQRCCLIPHRKARSTVILTTSRPWKFSSSGLRTSQVHHRFEITRLNKESVKAFKKSVISHILGEKDQYRLRQYVNDFSTALVEKGIADLEDFPRLLMYFLCLWCEQSYLEETQCDMYSNIVEFLLSRCVGKGNDIPTVTHHTPGDISQGGITQGDIPQGDIPQCFGKRKHCRQSFTHLISLGYLAFQMLYVHKSKEANPLVFDRTVAEQFIDTDLVTFFYQTGILTQNKLSRKLTVREIHVWFVHKSVQEFFAALYMHSTPDQSRVQEIVLSKCKCVQEILGMSKILIFLSGIHANMSSVISHELMKIINEDEISQKYRSKLEESKPLKEFQDLIISCCKEVQPENSASLCLQDVFIDESCQKEQYRKNLKQLIAKNKQNIRSLYIQTKETPYSNATQVMEYFELSDLENIEKIHYEGKCNGSEILPILQQSVKSLSLSSEDDFWSQSLYEKVISLQKLEAINISWFDIRHSELTLLLDYISQRHCLQELKLMGLCCTDHGKSCTGSYLDLSQHSAVHNVSLHELPVSEVKINMSSIEDCSLGLLNRDLLLGLLNCYPPSEQLKNFACGGLKSSAAIDSMLRTLGSLQHVKYITLWNMNLENRTIAGAFETLNMKVVQLVQMTMSNAAIYGLVSVVQGLQDTVAVVVHDCIITPPREFDALKDVIRAAQNFRVLVDWEEKFEFETIKDDGPSGLGDD